MLTAANIGKLTKMSVRVSGAAGHHLPCFLSFGSDVFGQLLLLEKIAGGLIYIPIYRPSRSMASVMAYIDRLITSRHRSYGILLHIIRVIYASGLLATSLYGLLYF